MRAELAKVPDVGLSYIVGKAAEAILIAPDPERLAPQGVTLQQPAHKVQGASRTPNGGLIRDAGKQVELVAGQSLTAPAEIASLLLTTRDERPVHVADVADVSFVADGWEQRVAHLARCGDGIERVPAVTLAVAKRGGADAVTVADALLARATALEGPHSPHPASRSRLAISPEALWTPPSGGPFRTPATPETGTLSHASPQPARASSAEVSV